MYPEIIAAIKDKYSEDTPAMTRAKRAGNFELILISLGVYDLTKRILTHLEAQIVQETSRNRRVRNNQDGGHRG